MAPPLPGVTLRLFGRSTGQQAPGVLIDVVTSDGSGFFNFFVIQPQVYEVFRLEIAAPEPYVVTRIESEDGVIQSDGAIEWVQPASEVHMNAIYFSSSTVTPTPSATPTQTVQPTTTPTVSPTPGPSVTATATLRASATPTPTVTKTPVSTATPGYSIWLPLYRRAKLTPMPSLKIWLPLYRRAY